MPVLILAIAPFLVVAAIVALMAIADALESQAVRQEKELASSHAPLLSISDAFDPICSVLWQGPIAALKLIDTGGASGIPIARLRPMYEEAVTHFPEIYEGSGFVPWLQFLEEAHLISWHGANVVLTPEGRAFLRFRFVTGAMVEV